MTEQRKKEKLTHSRKRDTNNVRKRAKQNPRNRGNDKAPKMRLPLIHATNPDTIKKYLTLLSLNSSQIKKVNKLRQSLEIDPV